MPSHPKGQKLNPYLYYWTFGAILTFASVSNLLISPATFKLFPLSVSGSR